MSLVDIDSLPDISVVSTDFQEIIDRLVLAYEATSGTSIPDKAVARINLTVAALAEQLVRVDMNESVKQTLVAFAISDELDHIVVLQELTRLAATPATCTIRFTFPTLISDYTIPAGQQVQSSSGSFIFETDDAIPLLAGATYGDIGATCTTTGAGANDIPVGEINNLLDNLAVEPTSVVNLDVSGGGGGIEPDDQLRERFRDSNSNKSTAGSIDSYKSYAKTASSSIVDVSVYRTSPGYLNICVLLVNGGIAGAPLLALVESACNAEYVRPLCDTPTAIAATAVDIDVVVSLDYYAEYAELTGAIKAKAGADLLQWANIERSMLGRDIVPDEITRICKNIAGTYRVNISSPGYQVLSQSEFCNVQSITVTMGSEYDG